MSDGTPVPYSIADGLLLAAWTLLSQVLLAVAVAVPTGLLGVEPTNPTLLAGSAVVGGLVTLGGALLWLRVQGKLGWRLLGPTAPGGWQVVQGVGVGLVGLMIVFGYQAAARLLLGPVQPPSQSILDLARGDGVAAVLSVLAAVAVAPVVEEVVFRGVLFQALRRWLGAGVGIVLSSLLFTAAHVELYLLTTDPSWVGLGALGLLAAWFAWGFHRAGSLVVVMVGHAVFNAVVIVLALAVA